jgi:general nucleoside transport system ATP-binding protein
MSPRLRLTDITKRYPGVVAADGVSFTVMPGELIAVLGENGAGKSTLVKTIYGVVQPDAGRIEIDGVPVAITSPAQARALGIAMVFQHFALFDTLTVAENIALGLPPREFAGVRARLAELAKRYGLEVEADRRLHDLSAGEQQRVEILRALLTAPRLLILDEPTAVLTPQAIERLFQTLRQLAADGVAVVFISHKLDEIRRLTTRCIVMRNGRVVAEVDPRAESEASLARLMIGAEPPAIAAHDTPPGAVALQVSGLTTRSDERKLWLHEISITLHSGEIVGIAGISGNGQAALMAVVSGEWKTEAGAVQLFGRPVGDHGPARRRASGLRYVPEQRLGHGAVPSLSLADNAVLTVDRLHRRGFIKVGAALQYAQRVIERFGVRTRGPRARASSLSGGNLQRFIVGREIEAAPKVLLVDQPTWGVDVGAAAAIRNALIGLRGAGVAILVVSEDLDELFELSDRLHVIAKGRLSPAVRPRDIGVDELGRWMAGLWPGATAQ